jgi:hypothetical protein
MRHIGVCERRRTRRVGSVCPREIAGFEGYIFVYWERVRGDHTCGGLTLC